MGHLCRAFILSAGFVALLVVGISGEGTPPGAAADGYIALGGWSTSDNVLSIDLGPEGAILNLVRGTSAKGSDSITISADSGWTLEVADAGGVNTGSPGIMEEYIDGAYVGDGGNLANKLKILVEGIGENDDLENVLLTDVDDDNSLSSDYATFAESEVAADGLKVDLEYSQLVASNDPLTTYRIDLIYQLSYIIPD